MSAPGQRPLVAVDVGNTRVKFGLFEPSSWAARESLPAPARMLPIVPQHESIDRLVEWLGPWNPAECEWWIGSVHRRVASLVVDWLRARSAPSITLLSAMDLPLRVEVPRPDMVGVDRLLAALAVNRLRPPGTPAIVVGSGTAITVDVVGADGAFRGGAILPGSGLAARALHEFTDLLPLVETQDLAEAPPALGTNTVEAMRSGIYWSAIGGVRELIRQMPPDIAGRARLYLTGGAAPALAQQLAGDAAYVPHLTLAGIALAAQHLHGQ